MKSKKIVVLLFFSFFTLSVFSQDIFNSDSVKVASISIEGELKYPNGQKLGSINYEGEIKNDQDQIIGYLDKAEYKSATGQILGTIKNSTHGKVELYDANGILKGSVMYGNEVRNAVDAIVFYAPEGIIVHFLAAYYLFF